MISLSGTSWSQSVICWSCSQRPVVPESVICWSRSQGPVGPESGTKWSFCRGPATLFYRRPAAPPVMDHLVLALRISWLYSGRTADPSVAGQLVPESGTSYSSSQRPANFILVDQHQKPPHYFELFLRQFVIIIIYFSRRKKTGVQYN